MSHVPLRVVRETTEGLRCNTALYVCCQPSVERANLCVDLHDSIQYPSDYNGSLIARKTKQNPEVKLTTRFS